MVSNNLGIRTSIYERNKAFADWIMQLVNSPTDVVKRQEESIGLRTTIYRQTFDSCHKKKLSTKQSLLFWYI
jgi:hypothetical protein